MASDVIRWVHLADLHMAGTRLPEIKSVLRALWTDLGEQIRELGGPLTLAVFTGDLAQSGAGDEYTLASSHFIRPLLQTTGLSPSQLYLVPGNHDVDRRKDGQIRREPVAEYLKSSTAADNWWAAREDTDHIFIRMRAYGELGKKKGKKKFHASVNSYTEVLPDAPNVGIVALNSAALSGLSLDASGNPQDGNHLALSRKQVSEAIDALPRDLLVRILLVHHPLDWLSESDRQSVSPLIQNSFNLMLHGHLHSPACQSVDSPQHQMIVIPCGTVYSGMDFLNGYNLVELDLKTGCGGVVLRRYSPQQTRWVRDTQSTGDDLNGYYPFVLESLFRASYDGDNNPDLHLLTQAHRRTPSAPFEGYRQYWHAYRRFREAKSTVGLNLLARMVRFQSRWLPDAEPFSALCEAAALLYGDTPDEALARERLEQLAAAGEYPDPIAFEIHSILARLCEKIADQEALRHHELVLELGRKDWVEKQLRDDQKIIRSESARSEYMRAMIAEKSDRPVPEVDALWRRAAQAANAAGDGALESSILKQLMTRPESGMSDEERLKQQERIGALENTALYPLLDGAATAARQRDTPELYYLSCAAHHGLGYDLKRIEVDVADDGSAHLRGTCCLLATTSLHTLDTYLTRAPGIRFTAVKPADPGYGMTFVNVGRPEAPRIEIALDHPLGAGKKLEYEWEAVAGPRSFATTAEGIQSSPYPFEWVAWNVIVPIRRLEIFVTIPSVQEEPLPKFEPVIWRMGPEAQPNTDAYRHAVDTAYRARIRTSSQLQPPDRRQLQFSVDNPWLALRYVLTWEVR